MSLQEISSTYHEHIPLDEIFEVCKERGFIPVMEDGEEWEGILAGHEGRVSIDLKGKGNHSLQIQWYRMSSGRFEVNAYIS